VTHELESLAFAAGERVDRLTKAQITEADFLQQFQFLDRALRGTGVGKAAKQPDDFIDRRVEEIGDAPFFRSSRREEALTFSSLAPRAGFRVRKWSLLTSAATDFHFQNMRSIAAAVAIGAADEHIAEELHLDLLEAGAATTFALALAGIEAECAGVEAALFGGVGLGEQFADVVERADVNGGVGTRGLAERLLVHEHGTAELFPTGQSG